MLEAIRQTPTIDLWAFKQCRRASFPLVTEDIRWPFIAVHKQCGKLIHMKAIQITFDEELLERLDGPPEVRDKGRSAVLRDAAAAYLAAQEARDISRRYQSGYGAAPEDDEEMEGWADEGTWPED